MNNLTQRILTGSAYVAIILLAVTRPFFVGPLFAMVAIPVSYTHLRAHET